MTLLDTEEGEHINVFDWQAEFSEIFQAGGFDAVIGNPPYIFTREQLSEEERQYFASKYQLSWEKHNTFMLFMERLLRLIGKNGKGGFIVPNSWLTIESAKLLREAYVPRLELIADLSYLVFRRVSMEPCIFTITGNDLQNSVLTLRINSEEQLVETKPTLYDRRKWSEPNYRIVFSDNSEVATIIDKIIQKSIALGDVFDVRTGLQAYEEGRGTPPQSADDVKNHVFDREKRVDGNSIKYLQGRDIGRYELNWSGMWMQYGHWLSQPREIEIFKRPRVLLREITSDYPYCLNAMFV
jgi:signal recognition particle subunit SEC65